jgi:hypothetical protein
MPRKKPPAEEDRKGTKCGICGEIRTRPTGYMYSYNSEWYYDIDNHGIIFDCIKFLKTQLDDSKSEIQDLKDRVRELERDPNKYH